MDKSKFSHSLIPCEIHSDNRDRPYTATENIWYKWKGIDGLIKPTIIIVYRGYDSDLVSSPWIASGVIRQNGEAAMPSLFHDIAFSARLFGLGSCNRMMKDCMVDWGVSTKGRILVSTGLLLGSWYPYYFNFNTYEAESHRKMLKIASEEVWDEYGKEFTGYCRI